MKLFVQLFFLVCLIGAALGVGKDVDHCTPDGTLYRMNRENNCKDCCCVKVNDKVDYTPRCTLKSSCKVPTPIEWDKAKKVFIKKFC